MLKKTLVINGGIGLAIVGLAGGTYLVVSGVPHASASSFSRTLAVSKSDLSAVATASGNVSPASTTVINAQNCSGPIASVSAAVGQQVSAGEVLVTIDPTNSQNALTVAQAQLDTANAQAAQQQASAGNQAASANQGLVNAEQSAALDASQQTAAVAAAQNQVAADSTALATAQNNANAQSSNQQVQSALSAAQGQLAKDSQALTQAQNQQESGALKDKQQVATAQTQVNAAANSASPASNTTSAQIAVDTAQKNLAACSLTAPVAGTVTSVNAVVGGTAGSGASGSSAGAAGSSGASGAGSSGSSGSTGSSASSGLVTISDTAHLEVVANFAESDISGMKVGDDAVFTFPALKPDTTDTSSSGTPGSGAAAPVTGKITAIAQTATTTSNVVSYSVTVSIINPPAGLRLGQSANISVTTATANQALVVPTLAITTTGARQSVTVIQNGTPTAVRVTTGISANGRTQVLTGLTEGDQIELPAISSSLDTTATTRTGAGGFGGFGGAGGSGGSGLRGGSGGAGSGSTGGK